MNKPTSFQKITSGVKTLATTGALILALNGCGDGKKDDGNLQSEREKGKIENVLDSNNKVKMPLNKGNIDNKENFPITQDFESLMKNYIYPEWKKGAEKYSRYAGIEKQGNIEFLSFPLDLKNSDDKNAATEMIMYVYQKMIIINKINSFGKITSDLRYKSGTNEKGEKGVYKLKENKPVYFYTMKEFHDEGIKMPQTFFNKFMEISAELYSISSKSASLKDEITVEIPVKKP